MQHKRIRIPITYQLVFIFLVQTAVPSANPALTLTYLQGYVNIQKHQLPYLHRKGKYNITD